MRQKFCCDKNVCRDEHVSGRDKNNFVDTKMILVSAPANDRQGDRSLAFNAQSTMTVIIIRAREGR